MATVCDRNWPWTILSRMRRTLLLIRSQVHQMVLNVTEDKKVIIILIHLSIILSCTWFYPNHKAWGGPTTSRNSLVYGSLPEGASIERDFLSLDNIFAELRNWIAEVYHRPSRRIILERLTANVYHLIFVSIFDSLPHQLAHCHILLDGCPEVYIKHDTNI